MVFSVPCDLGSSARELEKSTNQFYLNRFLNKLRVKMESKSYLFPNQISINDFEKIKSFRAFDDRYTAPLHGFDDADDFYAKASCGPYLSAIRIPTLLVNALNDPFLPAACYPFELAGSHDFIHLETPAQGGHVGFSLWGRNENWMEVRALEFYNQLKL
jgi:predicted alpha/beta-fold hydrolase